MPKETQTLGEGSKTRCTEEKSPDKNKDGVENPNDPMRKLRGKPYNRMEQG